MEQKQLTKRGNIAYLYRQLNKAGQRGEAIAYMAKIMGVKQNTVKNHYIKELPDYLTRHELDLIITYLQKQILNNNL
jgi:hypothetical protein